MSYFSVPHGNELKAIWFYVDDIALIWRKRSNKYSHLIETCSKLPWLCAIWLIPVRDFNENFLKEMLDWNAWIFCYINAKYPPQFHTAQSSSESTAREHFATVTDNIYDSWKMVMKGMDKVRHFQKYYQLSCCRPNIYQRGIFQVLSFLLIILSIVCGNRSQESSTSPTSPILE